MKRIPRVPLGLGIAGLLPFLVSAALSVASFARADWILLFYGVVIFAFMSGVFWGFAGTAQQGSPITHQAYLLSVIPPVFIFLTMAAVFLFLSDPVIWALWVLAASFLLLLVLDQWYSRQNLAPQWWMRLRMGLTFVVVTCLALGAVT